MRPSRQHLSNEREWEVHQLQQQPQKRPPLHESSSDAQPLKPPPSQFHEQQQREGPKLLVQQKVTYHDEPLELSLGQPARQNSPPAPPSPHQQHTESPDYQPGEPPRLPKQHGHQYQHQLPYVPTHTQPQPAKHPQPQSHAQPQAQLHVPPWHQPRLQAQPAVQPLAQPAVQPTVQPAAQLHAQPVTQPAAQAHSSHSREHASEHRELPAATHQDEQSRLAPHCQSRAEGSEGRVVRWRQLFETLDRERKGSVSRAELVRSLRAAKADNPEVLVAIRDEHRGAGDGSDNVLERAYQSIEACGDGTISLDEFCAQLENATPAPVPLAPMAQAVAPASAPTPAPDLYLAPSAAPMAPMPFRKLSRLVAPEEGARRLSSFERIPVPPTIEELDKMAPDANRVGDLVMEPAGESMRELGKQVHSLLAALEKANGDIRKLTELNGTLRTQSSECLRVREANIQTAKANEREILQQLTAVSEDVALLEAGGPTIADSVEQVQLQLRATKSDVATAHTTLNTLRSNNAGANDELAEATSRAESLRSQRSRAVAAHEQLREYQKQARRAMLLSADFHYGTTAETTRQAVLRLSYDRPPLLLHRTWRALRRALSIRCEARALEARRPVRKCRHALRRIRQVASLRALRKRQLIRHGLKSWRVYHRFLACQSRKQRSDLKARLRHWAAFAAKRATFRHAARGNEGLVDLAADVELRTSMVETMASATALGKAHMTKRLHRMVRLPTAPSRSVRAYALCCVP